MTETPLNSTDVEIRLPLPLDLAGTLLNLIGAAYPKAQVRMSGSHMTVAIDPADRIPDGDLETYLESFTPSMLEPGVGETLLQRDGVSAPEWLAHVLGEIAQAALDNAPNYIEAPLRLTATSGEMVMTVARSEGQTPHALRMAAEARVSQLEDKLKDLGIDPDTV